MNSSSLSPTAFFLLLLVAVLMGAHHVAARVAFDHGANVNTVIVARSVFTALGVGALVAINRVPCTLTRRQWGVMALIGVFIWLQSTLVYSATARIPVALALLAFSTFPIWTALAVWCMYRRRPDRSVLLVMPVIIIGLALALDVTSAMGHPGVPSQWATNSVGVAYALGAAAIYGIVLSLMQHEVAEIDGRVRTLLTMVVVATLSISLGGSSSGLRWPHDAAGWWGIVLLLLCFGTGFTMMFSLLPKLGVVGNSPILNAEPVAVLVLAWAVLGQRIGPLQVVGSLIVVAAVMALGLLRRR